VALVKSSSISLSQSLEYTIQLVDGWCRDNRADVMGKKQIPKGVKIMFRGATGEQVSIVVYKGKRGRGSTVVFEQPGGDLAQQLRLLFESRSAGKAPNKCGRFQIEDGTLRDTVRSAMLALSVNVNQGKQELEDYNLVVEKNGNTVRVRQFSTGALLIQGLGTKLFDEVCSTVEKQCLPPVLELATRFVSESEEQIEHVARLLSPALMDYAEVEAKKLLGLAYDFLNEWDQKYVVSSLCLLHSKIAVPEYSCMVMPASKAYEGYLKKLFLELGLVTQTQLCSPNFTFGEIWRKGYYKQLASRSRAHKPYLEKLENELDFSRHFMMHSDELDEGRVPSIEDAHKNVVKIINVIKDSYNFFISHGDLSRESL
jgi:hypothetical protein